jgi:ferrous iron transport protein B
VTAFPTVEATCHRPTDVTDTRTNDATSSERPPVVAIVGRPNVGKSTFFGRASGHYAETANVPGTTVGVARRDVRLNDRPAVLVDLPGAYSLDDRSDGLPVFWQLLIETAPDAIVVVVDAGDLARHLPLALACRDLGVPIVVAANLSDEATARGVELDLGRLSQLLAAPVHRTIGRRGVGVMDAVGDGVRLATARVAGARRTLPVPPYPAAIVRRVSALAADLAGGRGAPDMPPELAVALADGRLSSIGAATIASAALLEPERWAVSERWARQVERRHDVRAPMADRIARRVTAPWPGLPVFVLVTVLALGTTMVIGTQLANMLSGAWAATVSPVLTTLVTTLVPIPALAAAMLWALDSGLLAMLAVGIPFVLCFFVIIAVLEDSGYLASAAVLADRVFNTIGLPGRAAIPLLAATGCNVPAIYGTRVLDTRRERLLASFLITLTPCSARSAVVIAALAPFAGLPVALAAFGVVALIGVTAGVAANALVPGRQSPLVLELPPLRLPIGRQVGTKAWQRFRSFVTTATPIMLIGSFVLGILYETGATGPLGEMSAPVVTGILGLPPVAGIAIVLAFLRKELALQLLVVLAVAQYGSSATNLSTFMTSGQLFVFAVVTAVSVPCVATVSTLADEFGRRSALTVMAATLGIALLAGGIVARLVGAT